MRKLGNTNMKKSLSFFISFICSAMVCHAADDKSVIVTEYSKIETLQKPQDPLAIKKILVNASCQGVKGIKPLPSWVARLKNLEELDLGSAQESADRQDCELMTSLPKDLSRLSGLRKFVIDDAFGKNGHASVAGLKMPNSLEVVSLNRIGLKVIPDWVFKQTHLKHLSVEFGSITEIPAMISNLKELESLDLLSNQISALPRSMAQLKTLKSLKLGNNNLNEEQQAKIKALLPSATIHFENDLDDARANAE